VLEVDQFRGGEIQYLRRKRNQGEIVKKMGGQIIGKKGKGTAGSLTGGKKRKKEQNWGCFQGKNGSRTKWKKTARPMSKFSNMVAHASTRPHLAESLRT